MMQNVIKKKVIVNNNNNITDKGIRGLQPINPNESEESGDEISDSWSIKDQLGVRS